ncbi:MAG: hypothetical protein HUJ69_01925 [Lachnospiraceae bacterium]|nr:hypothetical protein [Lachnospiraceae bacterium]
MKKTFISDPVKMAAGLLFGLFLLILVPEFIRQTEYWGAVIFGLIGLVMLVFGLLSARQVEVSKEGIACHWFGLLRVERTWEEIREVGVAGMNVFKPKGMSKASGTLYIYFSEHIMTEDERLKMVIEWPKADVPFIYFTKKRMEHVQLMWDKKVEFFNAENARFDYK